MRKSAMSYVVTKSGQPQESKLFPRHSVPRSRVMIIERIDQSLNLMHNTKSMLKSRMGGGGIDKVDHP